MQSLILAAGMGKRLKMLTRDNTKCMVEVNGVTLIERMLNQLDRLYLERIVIVIGYEGAKLREYISTLNINTPIEYVENTVFDKTNNIYSLYLARKFLTENDTLLLESDLIFDDNILEDLIEDKRDTLALVDKYESWMDGTCIKITDNDSISAFISTKDFVFSEMNSYYKTVNIYKFSKDFSQNCYVPFLEAYKKVLGNNEYYEQVLKVITLLENQIIKAKRLTKGRWYEIDDIQDLDIASSIFSKDDNSAVSAMESRYGGYWRYPKILDFCYLVNPYFPPQRLMDELKANFETLLTQYPSGLAVNNMLAAKDFGVEKEHIVVGNGAAELINALLSGLEEDAKIGIIRPTFEEYPNRMNKVNIVEYYPDNDDMRYSADDLIKYFSDKGISHLILINPDNPTGNYIDKSNLLKLIDWSEKRNIKILVDESFVDFAEEENSTLIDESVIGRYKNLAVMKSISKSYGVPGLRLGIIVSSDGALICKLKSHVSIWNINSFAEFYLQIAEKYQADYISGLKLIKAARHQLFDELLQINNIRPIESQANYITVELTGNISSRTLTVRLLKEYNILIKDLGKKLSYTNKQFIRLAVRNNEDNKKLITALKSIMEQ